MNNNKYNKYCLKCGTILTGKQRSYCCREHSFHMYQRGLKVKAIRTLIDDHTFKTLLNQYPLELLVFGHIYNDGWNQRKEANIKTGTQTILWIINNPDLAINIFEVVSYRSNMLREIESYERKIKEKTKPLNFRQYKVECNNKCKDFDEYNYLCVYNSIGCNLNKY